MAGSREWRKVRARGVAIAACAGAVAFGAAGGARAQKATWPDLAKPVATGGGEKDAAVIVGIEKYAFVATVPGARDNADSWYAYLTKGRGVPAASVRLLTDRDATLERVRGAAVESAKLVGKGGTLWFVFIGHGAPSHDAKGGVLVGYDVQQNTDSLYARSLPQTELVEKLKSDRAANTVVVVDACFSGHTAAGDLVPGAQPLLPSKPPVLPGKVMLFSAGRSDEFAGPLPGAKRPAFSYLVLGALRGWGDLDKDGKVTSNEVASYTRTTLRTVLSNRTQTPDLQGSGEAVLVASAREAGPPLEDLVGKGDEPTAAASDDKPHESAAAAPSAQVAPANPGYAPAANQGYAPPANQGYAPPANRAAYAPPPNQGGYAPPANRAAYAPPNQGYAPANRMQAPNPAYAAPANARYAPQPAPPPAAGWRARAVPATAAAPVAPAPAPSRFNPAQRAAAGARFMPAARGMAPAPAPQVAPARPVRGRPFPGVPAR